MKMMQRFSTIKTWMRIMHGRLKRLKNQNMIKKLYSPPTRTHKKVGTPQVTQFFVTIPKF